MNLQITADSQLENQLLILHLIGMLNTETVHTFDNAITETKLNNIKYIILDLKALTYISSAGFRSIFRLTKFMQERGDEVSVANRQPQIQKVFDIIQALPDLQFFASDEEMDAYLQKIHTANHFLAKTAND